MLTIIIHIHTVIDWYVY